MSKQSAKFFSIFGQIETVAANIMIERGKAHLIEQSMIPETALYNKDGQKARFAVRINPGDVGEFEKLIADLRA